MDLGTTLGVWAHPDDDIYLSSGLMAANAQMGNRVVDVTATRGEGGSMDEERWPPETMAEVRTDELLRSLEVLGVHEHRFLEGFVDVDMDAPLGDGHRPGARDHRGGPARSVLTMGPEGMTGHHGHQDVSRWVTAAFRDGRAARRAAVPRDLPAGVGRPLGRPARPLRDLPARHAADRDARSRSRWSSSCRRDLLELKLEAIKCHESQIEALLHVFGDDGFREFMSAEYFRLVAEKEA